MVFSSLVFLIWFLPITVLAYWICPIRFRNLLLLAASFFFYGWLSPGYLLLLWAEILTGYFASLGMEKKRGFQKKMILTGAVALYVTVFACFKYTDFLITSINSAFQAHIPLLRIVLPAGISFYTFQIISYNTDVYRGKEKALHSLVEFAMYISLFCQLIAGPIVRYSEIAQDLPFEKRVINWTESADGFSRFVCGLSKKVLLANQLYALGQSWRTTPSPSVLFAWVFGICQMLYIYFDFSGYSDMAIGLSKMFGFRFPENFHYPFMASSFTEFWRRWHMSLTAWFRDYVYIPLGGSRVSKPGQIRNLLIVWLLTGIWHGAGWNFLLWGLGFFVLLVLEKFWLNHLSLPDWLRRIPVLIILVISFMLFSDSSLSLFVQDAGSLFGAGNLPWSTPLTLYTLRSGLVLLLAGVFGATPLPLKIYRRFCHTRLYIWLQPVLCAGMLLLCITSLVTDSFNPFLYFQF